MRDYVSRELPWDKLNIHLLGIEATPNLYKYRRLHRAIHVIGCLHLNLSNLVGSSDRMVDEFWMNAEDTDQPHINAFIADPQPHRLNQLNMSEVSIAYGLIAKRRLEDGYNDHQYIFIAVFSVSDFEVRIHQIWHDKQDPEALQICSSPIMGFKGGLQNNLDDWITILCWIAGEPVGDPKTGKVVSESEHGA
ncbi:hypothetical protein PENCOP_c009G08080 [Penicillium coprophilum]|uniref:Uncharacterized protein n=1 Tax=Penicillium coprophilum TaxID=36646 RepID=A0A1V6UH25_9EURO|nr:hypothetical protein PENCOP_c009G08080 [Penicillium coprophilum]